MKTTIEVTRALGNRCPRCTKYHEVPDTPDKLCIWCIQVLVEMTEHPAAQKIVQQFDLKTWLDTYNAKFR